MQQDIGLMARSGSDILWRLESNPDLTFYERIRRRLILQEVAATLRLPMSRNTAELNQLIDNCRLYNGEIKDYFGSEEPAALYQDQHHLTAHEYILMPPDVQNMVHMQKTTHPDFADRILAQHHNINDDIQFDNAAYLQLRGMIT